MEKIKKATLKNKLRIVFSKTKGESFTLLILVGVGSKYESKKESGISHFLEHMFFKGTKNMNSQEIAFKLDRIGAIYNAFTSYEYTGYYAKSRPEHFREIVDILSDIYLNSVFPENEILKERGVILEELKMYLDKPESFVSDIFMKLFYKQGPLSRPIIGTKKNILKFSKRDFLKFKNRYYFPANTVISITGPFDFNLIIKEIKEKFNTKKVSRKIKQKRSYLNNRNSFESKVSFKKTEQVNIMLGFPLFSYFDERKYEVEILNTILGKGMSSRLWEILREKLGIAYTFSSGLDLFSDTGFFYVSAGLDRGRHLNGIEAIIRELAKIKNLESSPYEIEKAKEMIKAELAFSLESTTQQALFYGTKELLYGKIQTPKEIFRIIDKIKLKDIKEVANDFFNPKKIKIAILGPVKKNFDKKYF